MMNAKTRRGPSFEWACRTALERHIGKVFYQGPHPVEVRGKRHNFDIVNFDHSVVAECQSGKYNREKLHLALRFLEMLPEPEGPIWRFLFVPRRTHGPRRLTYLADHILKYNRVWIAPVTLLELDKDGTVHFIYGDRTALPGEWLNSDRITPAAWLIGHQKWMADYDRRCDAQEKRRLAKQERAKRRQDRNERLEITRLLERYL